MNLTWYFHRLRKMGPAEIWKRVGEYAGILYSQFKFRNPARWPYERLAPPGYTITLHRLPGATLEADWSRYEIYTTPIDLTRPPDWFFSDRASMRWPACHYAKLSYRPDNPHGDVRINWELSRLQFLPAMAVTDEELAKRILTDWLEKNPYLHGPAYIASMEVALRWISIYWAACLFTRAPEEALLKKLTGLAVASGRFIESRLSTHSSAGNHLIVEATGLFWIGKALAAHPLGAHWQTMAREILHEQILLQTHPDGSNREQCFWYIGFVLDAIFQYFMLEDLSRIPRPVWKRIGRILEFVDDMVLPDGSFFDYGDRDDGFVTRQHGSYAESPFPALLNVGACHFKRPEWRRDTKLAPAACRFRTGSAPAATADHTADRSEQTPYTTYPDGGMTLIRRQRGRLLFRHARLGLGNTCGHGHADALSVMLFWNDVPVLIDLGSGQYNGDQAVRSYFRSTIAHNTVEIGGISQAVMRGTFLWDNSYNTKLLETGNAEKPLVTACHDGYEQRLGITHTRTVAWPEPHEISIVDSFSGSADAALRWAFHLGPCRGVRQERAGITADFSDFSFTITVPAGLQAEVFHGSHNPFLGWRSCVYGKWTPIHTVVFSGRLCNAEQYTIRLAIRPKSLLVEP